MATPNLAQPISVIYSKSVHRPETDTATHGLEGILPPIGVIHVTFEARLFWLALTLGQAHANTLLVLSLLQILLYAVTGQL